VRRRSEERYRQAVLFFLHQCESRRMGKVKLMKLLYYLDFDHFEKHGRSVTGDRYLRFPLGPLPEHGEAVLERMVAEGQVQIRGWKPLIPCDLSVFSSSELVVLRSVCARWRYATKQEIVDASHREPTWTEVQAGREVPYVYAYLRNSFGEVFETDPTDPVERARSAFSGESDSELQAETARVMRRVKSKMAGARAT